MAGVQEVGTWISIAGGKPRKISLNLAAYDLIIHIFRLSFHQWISILAAMRITGGAFYITPDELHLNLWRWDPIASNKKVKNIFYDDQVRF